MVSQAFEGMSLVKRQRWVYEVRWGGRWGGCDQCVVFGEKISAPHKRCYAHLRRACYSAIHLPLGLAPECWVLRLYLQLVQEEFGMGLHALSLHTRTPAEAAKAA